MKKIIKRNIKRLAATHPNIKKNIKLVAIGAVLAWVIPMYIMFFMHHFISFVVVKLNTSHGLWLYFLLPAVVTFFFYKILKKRKSLEINIAHVFFVVSLVLDIIFGLFVTWKWNIDMLQTFTENLIPSYILVFYGIYFLLNRAK